MSKTTNLLHFLAKYGSLWNIKTNSLSHFFHKTVWIVENLELFPERKGLCPYWSKAIQWPKEKGQSLIYKTLHRKRSFPLQRYIFSQETKIRFNFLDIKKISNFPSNFYHKFLVENCRAGLLIFLHLSCQFILFL